MDARSLRENLIDLLRAIASEEGQRQYARDVPFIDVPGELVCSWFDDLYHPDGTLFQEAFSERERSILADFDGFFRASKERLPASLAAWPVSPVWLAICRRAREVVDELGWGPACG